MSDNKNVVFRTAMGGYNKNDVNEYIVRTSAEYKEKEAFLRERMDEAIREAAELRGENEAAKLSEAELNNTIEELRVSISSLELEKNQLEIRNSELEERLSSEASDKMSEQENIIAHQFEQIESMREEIEALNEKLASFEAEFGGSDEIARKAQLYDKTSANIGEAIISANKTAEEIISSAKEEARILTEKAQKELDDKRRITEESARLAIESIFSKLTSAASENRKEIAAASAYSDKILEEAMANISGRNKIVASKIKNYEEGIWKSIRADLDSIGVMRGSSRGSGSKTRNQK